MRIYYTAFLMLLVHLQIAQLPSLYLKSKQALELGGLSKSATLYVVIENEKNADDAALIAALKSFWKVGEVKYLSGLEFSEKLKAKSLDTKQLYLYNNYTRRYFLLNYLLFATVYDGYYLTNDPVGLYNSRKENLAPPFLYFSANALYDSRRGPINGFYSLMVKNFNHDVLYCRNEENFVGKKKKNKRKNGVYFFKEDSLAGKTLLLVKEQTPRKEKQDGKKGKKSKNNKSEKNAERITDRYSKSKEPVVVFPEDIEHAVKIGDNSVLLYNGGNLYSAKDGSVYSTTRGETTGAGIKPIQWVSYLISAVALTWFITKI